MRRIAVVLICVGLFAPSRAAAWRAAVFVSDAVDSTCVHAAAGDSFEQVVWAEAPHQSGLVYVTLRFDFPAALDFRAAPEFEDVVLELVQTPYPDGTVEWNLVLRDCPSGWVRLFRQRVTVLRTDACTVAVHGGDSWIRDCGFTLHRVDVTSELAVNEPGCGSVAAGRRSWGSLKAVH